MAPNNSQWWLSSNHGEETSLRYPRDNNTNIRKVNADGNKLCPGKEWRYMSIRLNSRLIIVDRQWDKSFCDSTDSIQWVLKLSQAVWIDSMY